jgi:penicillin amidase
MRFLAFLLSAVLTIGLIFVLSNSIPAGSTSLPPLGHFLSPFTGFWQNAEPLDQSGETELNLPGLKGKVEIIFDERMVPHIFAENDEDAILAQGYLHAKYRGWQLDITTRAAGGRLAEILGPRLIEMDKRKRRQGFRTAAATAVSSWRKSEEASRLLDAYTNGINAYLKELSPRDYPLEFKLLNYAPEPWTHFKTALFVKSMAETLCFREYDLEETNALHLFGRELFDFLFPSNNPKQSPIIPEGTPWEFSPEEVPEPQPGTYIGKIEHSSQPKPPPFLGSNNWAVSGQKTASGYPILCNDPHLNLTLPAIWYEIHINTPEYNCYGASLPGLLGIIIGFNENIAWGETNVGHDVLDWYRIHWTDESRTAYLLDGKAVEPEPIVEIIEVKGQEAIQDTVLYTHWGPIVYEDPENPYHDMAMHWLGHEAPSPEEALVFLRLNKARNFADYKKALAEYSSPPQNFVFAARDGDIAMRVQGKFPLKAKEQGRFILEGDSTKNGWKGFIPNTQVPMIRNPERGFVASANQHSTAPDYPYYYYGNFDDYRGRYLNRRLAEMQSIDANKMQKLQNDNFSILAEEAVPLLLSQLDMDQVSPDHLFLKTLKSWDFRFQMESMAPVVFTTWFERFYDMVWDEMTENEQGLDVRRPEKWRTLEILSEQPDNDFFDWQKTPTSKEDASDLVTLAFQYTDSLLNARYDYKAEGLPDWRTAKGTYIPHLGRINAFNVNDILVGGYRDALNSVKKSNGPSWRMVVELGPEVRAYAVYPGGQSGNPGSPFYDDFISTWAEGSYYSLHLPSSPEKAGFDTYYKMILKP